MKPTESPALTHYVILQHLSLPFILSTSILFLQSTEES